MQPVGCILCLYLKEGMTGKKIIKLLLKHGWRIDRINGSHHVLKKPGNQLLIVPIHSNRDMKKGLVNSILKQAGLK